MLRATSRRLKPDLLAVLECILVNRHNDLFENNTRLNMD